MKKITRGALALGIGVSMFAIAPVSAFAATHDGSCDYKEFCVWQNKDYGGGWNDMAETDSTWANNYFLAPYNDIRVNDEVSSAYSNGGAVELFQNANYAGHYFFIGIDQGVELFGTNMLGADDSSYDFNDEVSSTAAYVP